MRHINLEMVYSKIHMLRLVLLQPNHAITFNVPIVIIIQSQNLTCRQTDIQQKLTFDIKYNDKATHLFFFGLNAYCK